MGNLDASSSRFRYIEDARAYALKRPGSERILKSGDDFLVEPLPDLPKNEDKKAGLIDFKSEGLRNQLKTQLKTGSSATVVEFLLDSDLHDGPVLPDRRFTVENGEVTEAQYSVNRLSDVLRSPEAKALEILREAIQSNPNALLRLSPNLTAALKQSEQLSPAERSFFHEKLESPQAQSAHQLFSRFFGPDESFEAAGVRDYNILIERMNQPDHKKNLETLFELARYPERFDQQYSGRDSELVSIAHTLKDLPGFRRYPGGQAQGVPGNTLKERERVFDNALRTIKQYDYKLQISHGMQFNAQGIANHDTQIDYRIGGNIFSVGLSGQDFNFSGDMSKGFGFADQADASKRLRLGFNSGNFDLRVGLARDREGKLVVERPESEAANRFIGRTGEAAKSWAEDHKLETLGIAAAVAAGTYAYSLANPNQDLALDFNQRFDLYNTEFMSVKGEVSPELHLKNGALDLGVRQVGIGASGNFRDHSYDMALHHSFENTTLRQGAVQNKDTELNLRYGYRNHSITLDNRYTYSTQQLETQAGYQQNFVHSATMDSYIRPYVQFNNGAHTNTGISAGLNKDFGGGLQMQLNVDYNQVGKASGGFKLVKQFDW